EAGQGPVRADPCLDGYALPAVILLLRVLEPGQRFDRVRRRSREDEPAVVHDLDLLHRDGHVVATHSREAARSHDGERHGAIRGYDEVLDRPHPLAALVVDRLADDVLPHTPAYP